MRAPTGDVPPYESLRLAAVNRLGALRSSPDPDLERIARLARQVCHCRIAAVSLIDLDRQVDLAAAGAAPRRIPRAAALCAHVIAQDATIAVADARADPRFAGGPCIAPEGIPVRRYASAPVRSHGMPLGTLRVTDPEPRPFAPDEVAGLEQLAVLAAHVLEVQQQLRDLAEDLDASDHRATHDPLTGLWNRRRFHDELAASLRGRGRTPPLVVYCDLDRFKAVNDTHGHHVGDQVLVEVAARLVAAVRHDDVVARLGGDEFVVLCPDLEPADASVLLDRLRAAVEAPIRTSAGPVVVGVSLGASRGDGTRLPDAILHAADAAMFDDKRHRRGSRR